ncbi:MAG: class II aldolase/adducin family protein [Desulfobacterales bacterium]
MGKYDTEKKAILECGRWLSEHGYFGSRRGSGGNISTRTKDGSGVAITPSGRPYYRMTPGDICIIDFKQKPLEGRLKPSVEAGMHIAIYECRPDVSAVVHTHSLFASILSVTGQSVPALFDEITIEIGAEVGVIPYAVSGSADLVQNVTSKMGNNGVCYILQNHGALSLGKSLDQAWKNAELLEKVAQIYYYALTTGMKITTLPKEAVEQIHKMKKSI